MQVKKQQLEPDIEQWTGSKSGKECVKAVYGHLAYLTYMQSTSYKILGWMNHKTEIKIVKRNINNLTYADDTTLMGESKEELKSLLMRVKEVREKAVLKQHSKYKDHGIQSDHFMTNRLGKCGNSDRFYILGLQNQHGL